MSNLPEDLQKKLEQSMTADEMKEVMADPRFGDWLVHQQETLPESKPRIATTREIRRIAEEGWSRNFNRQIPKEVLEKLFRGGKHVLNPLLEHHFIKGEPAEAHFRVQAMLHVGDPEEPLEIIFDMEKEHLLKLPTFDDLKPKRPEPVWKQVLDMQGELLESWDRGIGEFVKQRLYEYPLGTITDIENAMSQTLQVANPYWVVSDMVTLIEAAVESMPSYQLAFDDLLTPHGFVLLERPIYVPDGQGTEVNIRAFCWGSVPLTDNGVNRRPGIFLSAFTDRFYDNRIPSADQVWLDSVGWPRLVPLHSSAWPFGEEASAPKLEDERLLSSMAIERMFMAALWLISKQRIAIVTGTRPPRSERRRAERLQLPSEILVVKLRRTAPRQSDGDEPKHVEWSIRWIVSGHWRRLWSEKENKPKLVWVSSYIKGPEDRPLVVKKKVFGVVR